MIDSRFVFTTYRRQMKRFFHCVTIASHVDASLCTAELCTLIDDGKLANGIAMFLPIVVKLGFHMSSITKQYAFFSKMHPLNLNITIIKSKILSETVFYPIFYLQIFDGNVEQHAVVYNELVPPITARFISFRPLDWYGHISMRVELYGCQGNLGFVAFLKNFIQFIKRPNNRSRIC